MQHPQVNTSSKRQRDLFLESEGDQYFNRNVAKDINLQACEFILKYIKPGDSVLEIGCSDGKNLEYFRQVGKSKVYGIDPSEKAINSGKEQHPQVHLSVGTSDRLDFSNDFFDVVLFGFCLYLVDRDLLLRSMAEADRVLKNGGYLGITDFDVKTPKKRPYKHKSGVYSYKMDYSSLLLASPSYVMADKYCFSHVGQDFNIDPRDRVATTILYKNEHDAYFIEEE